MKASPGQIEEKCSFEESSWCEIKLRGKDILLIGCIYRSPNSESSNNDKLLSVMRDVCSDQTYSHLLLCGDFNYPGINWSKDETPESSQHRASLFMECVRDCFLHQHVVHPTHIRGDSVGNTLDLIMTNEENMVQNLEHEAPLGKSDHMVLQFSFCAYMDKSVQHSRKYIYSKGDYESMRKDLAAIDWSDTAKLSIDDHWTLFKSRMQDLINKHVPKQSNSTKKRRPLWMNDKALKKVKQKLAAFKRYMNTREGKDYLEYTKARNQAKWACKTAVKEFEKKHGT